MAIPDNRINYTVDDYWLFPEDNIRREIIDGELYVSASPFRKHQTAVGNLYYHLRAYLEMHPLGTLLLAPFSVVLSPTDVVEPDLLYVAAERSAILTDKGVQGAPDLVVEVLSSKTRRVDETVKRDLYARAGVREYWLVDTDERSMRIWRAGGRGFADQPDPLESALFPGFSLPFSRLFL
jgi:Uma2 family endonuclease